MAQTQKEPQVEEEQGAPEWMVTFSDCMTLLLTFFVLLLSFSSFDDKVYKQMENTTFIDLPSVYEEARRAREAVAHASQIEPTQEMNQGSEKPTLQKGRPGGMKQDSDVRTYRDRKVFFIASDRIFWGDGKTVSAEGQKILARLSEFLQNTGGQIVVSENRPGAEPDILGLERAWAAMISLTTANETNDLKKSRISITANSTMPPETTSQSPSDPEQRRLEVVILDRNISL